ncbi:threonine dehydratase 1 biosynthetic, chloroplastic-like [Miscanthus floridulus]|uniref:threonine dehydratase 1 biosynthetic, chloroplastic-like n=1 Tax=Miscanthus floridulus TaxID=154761 RepID=UPI00345A40BB
MVGLSEGEKHFIRSGIAQDLRSDGRKRLQFRALSVQTRVIPQANGSARVRLGASEIIASVKAELGKPSILHPDKGKVSIFVDCSPTAEPMFEVFSFKLRGAYNMMAKLPREQLERGVICSSAGNHAQGVALSAQRLGCDVVIVMPVTTPEIKWKSMERLGATVVLEGDSYDEAQSYAKLQCQQEGRTFIPPFDHPDVITGQGTVSMEIVRQLQGPLHAIFVPVGGGGLIGGIAAYVKIIGVEPSDANAMALSLCQGKRVMLEHVGGLADGVAVKTVGEETFRLCRELVDGIVMVCGLKWSYNNRQLASGGNDNRLGMVKTFLHKMADGTSTIRFGNSFRRGI